MIVIEERSAREPEDLRVDVALRREREVPGAVVEHRVARVLGRIRRADLVGRAEDGIDVAIVVEVAEIDEVEATVTRAVTRGEQARLLSLVDEHSNTVDHAIHVERTYLVAGLTAGGTAGDGHEVHPPIVVQVRRDDHAADRVQRAARAGSAARRLWRRCEPHFGSDVVEPRLGKALRRRLADARRQVGRRRRWCCCRRATRDEQSDRSKEGKPTRDHAPILARPARRAITSCYTAESGKAAKPPRENNWGLSPSPFFWRLSGLARSLLNQGARTEAKASKSATPCACIQTRDSLTAMRPSSPEASFPHRSRATAACRVMSHEV